MAGLKRGVAHQKISVVDLGKWRSTTGFHLLACSSLAELVRYLYYRIILLFKMKT